MAVILAAQHRAISTLNRKTHHIERFNTTLCQCVSRLVRTVLSFSKLAELSRCHEALQISLQPHESYGVARALHGHHYRINTMNHAVVQAQYDAVVVGGGIMGQSIALELVRNHARPS